MSATKNSPKNTNYLSSNRFKIVFPRVPNVQYFAQGMNIPDIEVPEVIQPTPFAPVKVIGINATFAPFTINIIADEDMTAWQEVHDWLVGTSFPRNFGEFQEVKRTGLYSDLAVLLLSNANNPTFEFHFRHAFPVRLGAIELTTTDEGDRVTFPATFSYTDYTIRRIKNP